MKPWGLGDHEVFKPASLNYYYIIIVFIIFIIGNIILCYHLIICWNSYSWISNVQVRVIRVKIGSM